jgi:hypothetical protein
MLCNAGAPPARSGFNTSSPASRQRYKPQIMIRFAFSTSSEIVDLSKLVRRSKLCKIDMERKIFVIFIVTMQIVQESHHQTLDKIN